MDKFPLRVDIISDVVCPWCIIGFKRLEQALAEVADRVQPSLHWHPFELNPGMPQGGQNLREHLEQKYGTTLEQSIGARNRIAELGAALGFVFDYYDEMRIYNTNKAHQLLAWARDCGRDADMEVRLFSAYFGKRRAVDEVDVLVSIAAQAGMDPDEARDVLDHNTYAALVQAEEAKWVSLGIHAVPAFVMESKYLVSGAQDVESFKTQIALVASPAA